MRPQKPNTPQGVVMDLVKGRRSDLCHTKLEKWAFIPSCQQYMVILLHVFAIKLILYLQVNLLNAWLKTLSSRFFLINLFFSAAAQGRMVKLVNMIDGHLSLNSIFHPIQFKPPCTKPIWIVPQTRTKGHILAFLCKFNRNLHQSRPSHLKQGRKDFVLHRGFLFFFFKQTVKQ